MTRGAVQAAAWGDDGEGGAEQRVSGAAPLLCVTPRLCLRSPLTSVRTAAATTRDIVSPVAANCYLTEVDVTNGETSGARRGRGCTETVPSAQLLCDPKLL